MRRSLQGERSVELDTAHCVADGMLSLSGLASPGATGTAPAAATAAIAFVGHPMFLDDGLLMMQQASKTIAAVDHSPTFPAFKAVAPPFPAVVNQSQFRHVLARILMPSFERAILTHFRVAADRRITVVALAVAWYRADHAAHFQRPSTISYPAICRRSPPIRWPPPARSNTAPPPTQPIVYSVGEDGIDNGGSEVSITRRYQPSKWDMQDTVTHLTRQSRPPVAPDEPPLSGVDAEHLFPATTQSTTQSTTQPAKTPDGSP